ncbi:TonB-dependent receptor [Cyclobacterium plantarum]|uniref:TonB-dependent receptor n=1 Tax=Cyclobacterium plantarum TaxID=2716263 RepID=UPI003F70595D
MLRYLFLLVCCGFVLVSAAQTPRQVSIEKSSWTFRELINLLENDYSYNCSYSSSILDLEKELRLEVKRYDIDALIETISSQANLKIRVRGTKILINRNEKTGPEPKQEFTLSGYISEQSSGEPLIGATVRVSGTSKGTVSNAYGFYSLSLPEGNYTIESSYLSFSTQFLDIRLDQDIDIDIRLRDQMNSLKEVVVTATGDEPINEIANVDYQQVNADFIKNQPGLVGEPDVIKSLQTIPGFKAATEGSSGISVRGGGRDQNLILLDEAIVFNPSHLFGFYSVFNPDAIKDVKAYKSGFPAQYGGRLSSVIDIKMKEGNNQYFEGEGAIGLVSSRLTLEGPISKDKSSFIVSARRTYADMFLKLGGDDGGNKASFYDLNAKINFILGKNDRLYLSGYFGRDLLRFFDQYQTEWGNQTATLRWNHVFHSRLFSNTSLIFSNYFYDINYFQRINNTDDFGWRSNVQNVNVKTDFTCFVNPKNTLSAGISALSTKFVPGENKNEEAAENVSSTNLAELSLYVQNEHQFNDWLSSDYGIRVSAVANSGKNTFYTFDSSYEVSDTLNTDGLTNGNFVAAPRVSIKVLTGTDHSTTLKASYSRTYQFMQTLANTSLSFSAFDINLPTTPNTDFLSGDQISLALKKSFNPTYQFIVEGYYKWLDNVIDYKDHARLIQNPLIEGEIRAGRGKAYGIEFLLEKIQGKVTGRLSYTLSKSRNQIEGINEGRWYNSPYDRPHHLTLSTSYQQDGRWSFFSNFTYSSGNAFTFPTSFFNYDGLTVPLYSDRNSDRMPDYHRLDLAARLKNKKKKTRLSSYWEFSVYNAYARINPISIAFGRQENALLGEVRPGAKNMVKKTFLFYIIPSVSYNIKF